jgi:hypothetical protein
MTLSRSFIKTIIPRVSSIVLVVFSLVIGLLELTICFRLFMFLAIRLLVPGKFSNTISVILWFLLGFGYLAFIIYSAEYHIEHFGKPQSWKFLAKTFGVELVIFVLGYLV